MNNQQIVLPNSIMLLISVISGAGAAMCAAVVVA
jgi:hypothetical protein